MSYKRVITKKGKNYGPYLYESYRDENGITRKRYLGKAKKKEPTKKIYLFTLAIFLLSILLQTSYTTNIYPFQPSTFSGSETFLDITYKNFLTGLSVTETTGSGDSDPDSSSDSPSSESSSSDSGDTEASPSSDSSSDSTDSESPSSDSSESEETPAETTTETIEEEPVEPATETPTEETPAETTTETIEEEPVEPATETPTEEPTNNNAGSSSGGSGSSGGSSNSNQTTNNNNQNNNTQTGSGGGSSGGSSNSNQTTNNNNQTSNGNNNNTANQNNNQTQPNNRNNNTQTTPAANNTQNNTIELPTGVGPPGSLNITPPGLNQTLPITNQTLTNNTQTNNTLTNTSIITVGELIQYKAVLGQPVKWAKKINLTKEKRKVELPKQAKNISVKTGRQAEQLEEELETYKETIQTTNKEDLQKGILTGQVSRDTTTGKGIFARLLQWLRSFTISGRVITEQQLQEDITAEEEIQILDLTNIAAEEQVLVEYYTEAPQAKETNTQKGKDITIYSTEELGYTNILAFTTLEEGKAKTGEIILYWDASIQDAIQEGYLTEEQAQTIQTDIYRTRVTHQEYDTNNNGYIDHIEWNVPHLSDQNYSLIIEITDAKHLDENKTFIRDVYNETKEKDGIWTQPIHVNEYIRVTFEEPLDRTRDITIHAKKDNQTTENVTVEVYLENGTEMIMRFPYLTTQETTYKEYLTGMNGTHDTFDLKIVGQTNNTNAYATFDHIIDPVTSNLSWWTEGGEITLGASSITSVDLSKEVNQNKAFILTERRAPNGATEIPTEAGAHIEWVNNTRFNLVKIGTAGGAIYSWYVIEGEKLSVQHGIQEFTTAEGAFNITINPVDVSKTVPIIHFASCTSTNNWATHRIFWTGNITNTTNLYVQRDVTGECAGNLSYSIIEFNDGSTIQQGEIANVLASGTYAHLETTVDQSNTWIYYTSAYNVTAQGLNDVGITVEPYNTTAFYFDRYGGSEGNARVQWYAISTPGATVQNGTYASMTNNNITINTAQLNTSFSMLSFENSGAGSAFQNTMGTSQLLSTTNLNIRRGTTSNTQNAKWQVINFDETQNYAPSLNIATLTLNSTSGATAGTTDNLTLHYTTTGAEGIATDWRINGTSHAVLNLPFEKNISTEASNELKDLTTHNTHATLGGGTATRVPTWKNESECKIGGCYFFNASEDDYIRANNQSDSLPKTELTVMGWFKPLEHKANHVHVQSNWFTASQCGWNLVEQSGGSLLNFVIQCDQGNQYQELASASTSTDYPLDTWTHVAGTFNGTNIRIYINGTLIDDTINNTYTVNFEPRNQNAYYIGGSGATNDFNGTMDQIRIYKKALSPEQIKAIYQDEEQGNPLQTVVSQETSIGETWAVNLTVTNYTDERTQISNNLTILSGGLSISNVQLQSQSGINHTNENVTVTYAATGTYQETTDWRLDETSILLLNTPYNLQVSGLGATVFDYSTHKNNGTLGGATDGTQPVWNISGAVGGAYTFDGNDYINHTNINIGDLSGGFTQMVFFQSDSPTDMRYLGSLGDSRFAMYITQPESVNTLNCEMKDDLNNTIANQFEFDEITTSKFYLAACIYDQETKTLNGYVDKVLSTPTNINFTGLTEQSYDYLIGEDYGIGEGLGWIGEIDEVRLYNRALTKEQLDLIHNDYLLNKTLMTTLLKNETYGQDNWTVTVYANNWTDHVSSISNTLYIQNNVPNVTSVTLNTTTGYEVITDNLTLHYKTQDTDKNALHNTSDWRLDGTSIAPLNIPFDIRKPNPGDVQPTLSTASTDLMLISGTYHDGTQPGFSCTKGGCYFLDGVDDYLTTANKADVEGLPNITISLWLNADESFTTCKEESCKKMILHKGNYSTGWEYALFYDSTLSQIVWAPTTDGIIPESTSAAFDSSELTAGAWKHLAATWEGGTGTYALYLDGVVQGTDTASGTTLYNSGANLSVGSSGDNGGTGDEDDFPGFYDEILIFDRVLTGTQINTIYEEQSIGGPIRTLSYQETNAQENWTVQLTTSDLEAYTSNLSNDLYLQTPGTNVWNCSTEQVFTNVACWTLGRLPVAGDHVIFNGTGNGAVNAYNNTMPQGLGSFTIEPGYTNIMTFRPLFAQGDWTGANDGTPQWEVLGIINISGGAITVYSDVQHSAFTSAQGNITPEGYGQSWKSITSNIYVSNNAVLDGEGTGFPTSIGGPGRLGDGGACHAGYRIYNTTATNCRSNIYGNLTAPTSPGASGVSGAGGGAIKLATPNGNIHIGGILNFTGSPASSNAGAGGSIWLKGKLINITGGLYTRGGNSASAPAGAGGRIRIEYENTMEATGIVTTKGGEAQDTGYPAHPGTLTFTNSTWIGNARWRNIGLQGGNYGDGPVINIQGNLTITGGLSSFYGDYITATNNWNTTQYGSGVWINSSGSIIIETGTTLDAQGTGFPENTGPAPGTGAVGGSHGGEGIFSGGPIYGDMRQPTALGSGGGYGGGGGGAIKLTSQEEINVNGIITAAGWGTVSGVHTNSAGSIWLDAKNINITSALGAVQSSFGGGGRIAVTGTNISASPNGFILSYSQGGEGGTIYLNATEKLELQGTTIQPFGSGSLPGGNFTFSGDTAIIDTSITPGQTGNTREIYYNNCNLSHIYTTSLVQYLITSCDFTKENITFQNPSYMTGLATSDTEFTINASIRTNKLGSRLNGFTDIQNTTLGWWKGDIRRENILLDHLNRNNGTVMEETIEVEGGKFGSALSFNSDGKGVNLSDILALKSTFTVSLWINTSANTTLHGNIFGTRDRHTAFFDDFSIDRGWSGTGTALAVWNRAAQGGGIPPACTYGTPPSTDVTPSYDEIHLGTVVGGCYANNLAQTYYAVSPSIDCTSCTNTNLSFWRMLGIESNAFDHAYIDAYNGTDWVQIYENPSTNVSETSWTLQTYNVSAHADGNNNFSVRFGFGTTDATNDGIGFNIDDLEITYENQQFDGDEISLSTKGGTTFIVEDAGAGGTSQVNASTNLNDGQWHHILATFIPGVDISLYIDGNLSSNASANGGDSLRPSELFLGEDFYGQIDDILLFERALNEQEIKSLYGFENQKNITATSSITADGRWDYTVYSQDTQENINSTRGELYIDTKKPSRIIYNGLQAEEPIIQTTLEVTVNYSDTLTNLSLFTDLANKTITWLTLEGFTTESFNEQTEACNGVIGDDEIEIIAELQSLSPGDTVTFTQGPQTGQSYDVVACGSFGTNCELNEVESAQCCSLKSFTACGNSGINLTYDYNINVTTGRTLNSKTSTATYTSTNATANKEVVGYEEIYGRWGGAANLQRTPLIGESYSWRSDQSFSFATWVYPMNTSGKGISPIITKLSSTEYLLGITAGGNATFKYYNTTSAFAIDITTQTNITPKQWNLIVATYNGSEATLYLNGIQERITTQDSIQGHTFASSTNGIAIGAGRNSLNTYETFKGYIDDTWVFNRSLSPSEVELLYTQPTNGTKNINLTGLQAGEYNYTTYVQDYAGNTNNTETRQVSVNLAPEINSFNINSTLGLNRTAEDLHCTINVTDPNGGTTNITIHWYNENIFPPVLEYEETFTGVQSGTKVFSTFESGNTSKQTAENNWRCNATITDGQNTIYGPDQSITIVNTPPVVQIYNLPTYQNITTNRTPEFNWTTYDADGDPVNSTIYITAVQYAGGSACSDARSAINITSTTYTPTTDLLCLTDNGYRYDWSVYVWDGEDVGEGITSISEVFIQAYISSNVTVSNVNFGIIGVAGTNNTSNDSPPPFVIENNGNAVSNISINSTAFWDTITTTSHYYQYSINETSDEPSSFDTLHSLFGNWYNVSLTGAVVSIAELNYEDANDEAEIELQVEVPGAEGAGAKGTTIIFAAELAE